MINPNTHTVMNLKRQLELMLRTRGITASALAKKSGISKQTLSDWLAGREPRKLSQLKKVAEVLGLSIDDLCFGETKPSVKLRETVTDIDSLLGEQWVSGLFEIRFRRIKK